MSCASLNQEDQAIYKFAGDSGLKGKELWDTRGCAGCHEGSKDHVSLDKFEMAKTGVKEGFHKKKPTVTFFGVPAKTKTKGYQPIGPPGLVSNEELGHINAYLKYVQATNN